jgi:hypothetical protein
VGVWGDSSGAAWETINLSTYRELSRHQTATTGLDAYAYGDANILSQVKLSDSNEITGRVNINTNIYPVLNGLLEGVRVGCTYTDPAGLGDDGTLDTGDDLGGKLDEENCKKLINKGDVNDPIRVEAGKRSIMERNGSGEDASGNVTGQAFAYRAAVATADRLTLSDTSIFTAAFNTAAGLSSGDANAITDAKKEEIIGKIANLITVRQNYFTVLITSQIVKDLITGYGGGTRGEFNVGIDKVLAEQRLMTVYYRDAITNRFEVLRYEYLDE